jgi:shikimate 5-dehydrogenase/shikimate kinase/3-dehydroquinate dehydratase
MRLRPQEPDSRSELGHTGNTSRVDARNSLILRPHRTYSTDASILLVGLRGTGRSTLALVASTALGFRVVDSGRIFQSKLGQTRTAYAANHGPSEYRRQELEILQSILQQHPKGAVIVCGSATVEGAGKELVRKYSRSHPVIFVLRDASDISQYVGSCDEKLISDLVDRSSPSFRRLSNLEFYNLSEPSLVANNDSHNARPWLMLKSMERDFLQWFSSTRQQMTGMYMNKAEHSLSSVPLEKRAFTYCLSLPLEQASLFAEKSRQTDILADAIELQVEIASLCSAQGFNHTIATHLTRQYFIVRRSFQLPIVLHVILPVEEGHPTALARKIYLEILAHCLRLAPDYLTVDYHLDDVEIDIIQSARGYTRIIGHYFQSLGTSHQWCSPQTDLILQRMERSHCDIARLCKTASSRTENQSIQEFIHSAKLAGRSNVPIITYNTGRLGRPSCVLNQILTPITHPLLKDCAHSSGHDSSWLLTIQELQAARCSSYTLEPQFFGILGADVQSSLSPAMHNSAFEAFKLPHKYLKLQTCSLGDLKALVRDSNFGGASITAPFKQEIIPVLDFLSQSSRAIGAVNTLLPLRTGGLEGLLSRHETGPIVALYGDNTDWIGIFNSVRQHLSPVNAVQANTTALVIGAGGMAHACVYSFIRLGIQTIFVCNRTQDRAETLANRFRGKTYSIDHTSTDEASTRDRRNTESPVCGPADIKVIPPNHSTWPAPFDPPTIIVSCIPSVAQTGSAPLSIPDQWLAHKTGGVLIEVSVSKPYHSHR